MHEHIDAFIHALGDVSPHTRRTYRNDLAHFGRWYAARNAGQPVTLGALTAMTVVLYKAALVDRLQFRPATVRRRLATLHRFSQWAAAEGLITDIPTEKMKMPAVPPSRPRRLDPAAVERLLLEAQQDPHMLAVRNYAILRLLADVGLRVGALVALRRADVTAPAGDTPARLQVGRRVIPLPCPTWDTLQAYLARRPDAADERLFLSTRGAGLHTETVRHMINKYARRAGLDPGATSPRMLHPRQP